MEQFTDDEIIDHVIDTMMLRRQEVQVLPGDHDTLRSFRLLARSTPEGGIGPVTFDVTIFVHPTHLIQLMAFGPYPSTTQQDADLATIRDAIRL